MLLIFSSMLAFKASMVPVLVESLLLPASGASLKQSELSFFKGGPSACAELSDREMTRL